jgi:hypothetical protein
VECHEADADKRLRGRDVETNSELTHLGALH